MEKIEQRKFRRGLLSLVAAGILLAFLVLVLELATLGHSRLVVPTSGGPDATTKTVSCAADMPIAMQTGSLWLDLVLGVVAVFTIVLAHFGDTSGLPKEFHLVGRVLLVLVAVVVVWVAIEAYVNLSGGEVWFAPKCPGGS